MISDLRKFMEYSVIFARQVARHRHGNKGLGYFKQLRFFAPWYRSLSGGGSPLSDNSPWLVFAAIDFLINYLSAEMRVFEYGSGGSTLFFLQRVRKVITIEHDPTWAAKVSSHIGASHDDSWKLHLVEPKEVNPDQHLNDYLSMDPQYKGKSFEQYVQVIERYPDRHFDLILIDGRSRPSCFKHSLLKTKVGGYVIWDNTDRNYYAEVMKYGETSYIRNDFAGPTPYVPFFTKTSTWLRISS